MVLPHNKLGGARWAYLREWLIRQVRVVAVLGMDRAAFLPHTHQEGQRPLRRQALQASAPAERRAH